MINYCCHTNRISPIIGTSMYFYLPGKSTYSFSYACAIEDICVTTSWSCVFFVRSVGYAFFFGGEIMTLEEVKKERDMYKKMYFTLSSGVSDAIDICNDTFAKRILIDSHLKAEEIYISTED